MKVVYQCNDDGFLVCETLVQESPLEPGVWLMPPNCVEVRPPDLLEHQGARWDGEKWNVVDFTPEFIPPADPWDAVRSRRNQLLQQTDWMLLPDSPKSDEYKELLKVYRQRLRDIPQDFSDPPAILWPTHP